MAVCSRCLPNLQACPKDSHYWAFRLPQGLAMLRKQPCEPSPELGRDGAFLPVTHVGGPHRGPTDSGGLWFYYARGCSDLLWDMGRTLVARNRVHAAVLAEQRMALLSDGHFISDREAISRVAAFVQSRYPKWSPLAKARRGWLGLNASIADAIAEASRGFYGDCSGGAFTTDGALQPCLCRGNGTHGNNVLYSSQRRRMYALVPLAGDKVLSLHSEPLLRRLPLDTITLHKQPQGGGSPLWTTEIWDLRGPYTLSRHLENATAHPEVVSRSRWASSTGETATVMRDCRPAPPWHTCMACAGSQLEQPCRATVDWYVQKERGRGRG